jgi:hypothetical protein
MATGYSNMRSFFVVAAAFAALSTGALAQNAPVPVSTGTNAVGAGNNQPLPVFTKLSDAAIAQFKANPQALLTIYASAGLPLSTQVRSLLLTDPTLIDTLISVAKGGNDTQQAAMGAGLGQAASILAKTNPQLAVCPTPTPVAACIQQKVAQSGLSQLIIAYIAASNGTITSATGAGGGGGGSGGPTGGVGGGGNGGQNVGGNGGGSDSTVNSFSGNSAAGAGGFANPGTSGGGTTIITTSSASPT